MPASRKSAPGFTLIELAVVIGIMAILAAVAIPRLTDTNAQSELTTIKDFKMSLLSAATMYKTAQNVNPTNFWLFVCNLPGGASIGNYTITTYGFGPNATTSPCTIGVQTITCTNTFKKYSSVVYTINNNGQITGTATAAAGNTLGNAAF